jgi:hypothetical protein
MRDAELDDFAFARDASPYRMSNSASRNGAHLVLDDLDARFVADDFLAALDGADTADVEAHRGVELERVTARGGFRVAESRRSSCGSG